MTEREAIEWLKGCVVSYEVDNKGKPNGNITCDLTQEVLDMAISALEKQEQERWHSVAKEGNPKESGLYIVTDNSKMDGNKPHTRYFNAYGDEAFWSGWKADEVVAWKEITSEPYTEEES